VIAFIFHPAAKGNRRTDVGFTELTAGMGTEHEIEDQERKVKKNGGNDA
jgi:hypothetical protein